jgi:acyl-CoA synthetase (AMP-forming)/AMP-acid ligase II
VMQGYYHNPEANRAAFTEDGWFRSGDLGRFDKGGHLYIVTSCGLVLRLRLYEFDSRRQIFLRLLNEAGCYLSQLLR